MSALKFDAETGVIAPTAQEIRDELVPKFVAALKRNQTDPNANTDPTSPLGQIIDCLVAEIESSNEQKIFLANMMNLRTAKGKFLDALASLYGLERKVAEATVVNCLCRGLKGTAIPQFSLVKDALGNYFRNLSAAVIGSNGTVEVEFTAVEKGALEVAASTVTGIVTVVAGWDTVTNEAGGATGNDQETDADFRARIKKSVAINSISEASSVEAAIANVSGVLDCVVLENYTNQSKTIYGQSVEPHSIAISVRGGSDKDIAEAIWDKKSGGCGTTGTTLVQHKAANGMTYLYYIIRPSSVAFKIKVKLWNASVSDANKAAIVTALLNNALGEQDDDRIGIAEKVYASRFIPVITEAYPSAQIRSVQLAIGSGNYAEYQEISALQFPTITKADITVEVGGGA